MLDRHGNIVFVGWPEHQILWLRAALELDRCEHYAAFSDIAGMTGRTICAVRQKAYDLRREIRTELERSHTRRIMAPSRNMNFDRAIAPIAPSEINTSAAMAAKRVGARA